MSNIRFYLHNIGETLALLCIAGLFAVFFRWRVAARKDFLLAFALMLIGIFLREYAVWRYEAFSWPDDSMPLYITTISRVFMVASAALYVRGAVKDRFGEYFTPALIIILLVIALIFL